MIIKDVLNNGIQALEKGNINEASLNARLLLAYILKCRKEDLIIYGDKEIDKEKQKEFYFGIEKLQKNYPLQYILGKKEFMKMEFIVNENVLIPRADTEILVEEVLNLSNNRKDILDLCTGSGAIAISIAKNLDKCNIIASDLSTKALEVAKENEKKLLEKPKINFIKSNMFENIEQKFDIIVSNPPYIKTDVISNYDLEYEPKIALDGGKDGLDFYRVIIKEGHKYLNEERSNCY